MPPELDRWPGARPPILPQPGRHRDRAAPGVAEPRSRATSRQLRSALPGSAPRRGLAPDQLTIPAPPPCATIAVEGRRREMDLVNPIVRRWCREAAEDP